MKRNYLYFAGISAALLLAAGNVVAESPNRENAPAGLIYRDGVAYIVVDGKATRVDDTTIPKGQMMTLDGKVVPEPDGITGVREGDRASEATKTPATPSAEPAKTDGAAAAAKESTTGRESSVAPHPGKKD